MKNQKNKNRFSTQEQFYVYQHREIFEDLFNDNV